MERVTVRKLHVREVVRWMPNLRDHGRTVDRPLLNLLARLQEKHGQAWASEDGLRRGIAQDTGHMPGVSTVAKALRRLGAQGLVVQVWLHPGQIMPNGAECTHGTRLVYVPKTRRAKRAARAFNARQNRRAGYETRRTAQQGAKVVAALAGGTLGAAIAKPGAPVDDARSRALETERRRQLAAAAEWMARERPPDT